MFVVTSAARADEGHKGSPTAQGIGFYTKTFPPAWPQQCATAMQAGFWWANRPLPSLVGWRRAYGRVRATQRTITTTQVCLR